MIRRYELSDAEWDVLAGLLPPVVNRGRPRMDDRRVLNGIAWKIRSGAPWRDVPERYGPQWRGIATRYDKTSQSHQATITIAAIHQWLPTFTNTT